MSKICESISKEFASKVNELKEMYENDKDALDVIERGIETLNYHIRRQELDKAKSYIVNLEVFLHDWF